MESIRTVKRGRFTITTAVNGTLFDKLERARGDIGRATFLRNCLINELRGMD